MKRPKHIILISVCAVAVIATLVVVFAYNTRGRAVLLDTSVSPDGSYQLSLFSVGEPDWPFGSAHGRITLSKDNRKLSETEIDLADDGCQISRENWSVVWREDCAEITLRASEQADEHWKIYYDGRVEQLPYLFVWAGSADASPPEEPAAPDMSAAENDRGEALFRASADDFIENFNFVFQTRNGYSYLKPLDEWVLLGGKTPFSEYAANYYRFSADPQIWSMPTLSIFVSEDGDGIYEIELTFDDHGYQESMYLEYREMCICALSAILPELSGDEIAALYSSLYTQTARNFWGDYFPDSGEERPCIEVMCRSEDVGLFGYYGAGTANICIVPLLGNTTAYLDERGIESRNLTQEQ